MGNGVVHLCSMSWSHGIIEGGVWSLLVGSGLSSARLWMSTANNFSFPFFNISTDDILCGGVDLCVSYYLMCFVTVKHILSEYISENSLVKIHSTVSLQLLYDSINTVTLWTEIRFGLRNWGTGKMVIKLMHSKWKWDF